VFKSVPAPKNPPAQTTAAPTLRDLHPSWGVLSDKVRELSVREDALLERLWEIGERQSKEGAILWQGKPIQPNGQPPADTFLPPTYPPPLSKRALDILGEHAPPPGPKPLTNKERAAAQVVKYTLPGDEEAAEIGRELRALTEAKDMLHPLLLKAHAVGSGLLCDARREDYRIVAATVCAALVAVGDAVLAHRAFTGELVQQGAMWHQLKPVDVETITQLFGDPRDRNSTLRRLLWMAADAGHHDPKTLPASWDPPVPEPVAVPNRSGRNGRSIVGVFKRVRGKVDSYKFVVEERQDTPGDSTAVEGPVSVISDSAGC
jgi:hypothetical protein